MKGTYINTTKRVSTLLIFPQIFLVGLGALVLGERWKLHHDGFLGIVVVLITHTQCFLCGKATRTIRKVHEYRRLGIEVVLVANSESLFTGQTTLGERWKLHHDGFLGVVVVLITHTQCFLYGKATCTIRKVH